MVKLWRSLAETRDFEVVIAVDGDDKESQKAANSVGQAKVVVQSDLPGDCVKGWNLAAANSVGKVIIAISDDFFPIRNWDTRILGVSDPGWIDRRHVVMVNDGYVKDLCTLPIVTRVRYTELGYLFYPGYKSMYCDTDMTQHAIQDGVLIRALHLVFSHYHPDNQMRVRDLVDVAHSNGQRYEEGRQLFEQRCQLGFPPV